MQYNPLEALLNPTKNHWLSSTQLTITHLHNLDGGGLELDRKLRKHDGDNMGT